MKDPDVAAPRAIMLLGVLLLVLAHCTPLGNVPGAYSTEDKLRGDRGE